MRLAVLGFLIFSTIPAFACRCAERTLSDYYAAAGEVFIGNLTETKSFAEGQTAFRFEKQGEPYKNSEAGPLPYVSYSSSASCAVPVEPGAVYVVFAEFDEDNDVFRITSCNGTRVHRDTSGDTFGFQDVPARFVVSQLTALAGLNALQAIATSEPRADNPDNTTTIGLVDIARLAHSETVSLHDSADHESNSAAVISGYDDIEHREASYEFDAAVVFATYDGWYKLQLSTGNFAWLSPESAGTYWPLETLLPKRLNYLTREWNRILWSGLGAGNPVRLAYDGDERPREQAARILQAKRIGGSLWLEVEVLNSNGCDGETPKIRARGWIPAYSASGQPVAWFYSRGC